MRETITHLKNYLAQELKEKQIACPDIPLFHTAPFLNARDYIERRKLSGPPCDVFDKEDIIYLFLGRAEYRDYNAPHLREARPISFAIKPAVIKASTNLRIFPFDTGALVQNRYSPVIKEQDHATFKRRFLVGEKQEFPHAYALINILYDSPSDYINQNVKDFSKIVCDEVVRPDIDSLKKIYVLDFNEADERKSALEFQVMEDIDFNQANLFKVIAPGIILSNYKALLNLLIELKVDPQINPDKNPHMEPRVQNCYSTILSISIDLSLSECQEN